MTENEIINRLHLHGETMTQDEAFFIMDALEEIQQYRAIGTVEEIKANKIIADERYDYLMDDIGLLKQYASIGTIDEFKSLKEKNEPRKPYKGSFGVIRCSCCDEKVGQMVTSVLKEDCMNFCAYCGSKVDWSE